MKTVKRNLRDTNSGWEAMFMGNGRLFLTPKWGPALRTITREEYTLYFFGKASPVRVGYLRDDIMDTPY